MIFESKVLPSLFHATLEQSIQFLKRDGNKFRNYSAYRGKTPNLRCLRVRSTRKHLKFGNSPLMAEQLRLDKF